MLSKIILILSLVSGFFSAVQAQNENIYFKTIPPEAGLSQLSVSCIFQDSKGFLWFGTRDGLNRYDGYNFEVFKNDPTDSTTISNNNISSIVEDKQGNIWIATEKGLNCYHYASNNFTSFFKSADTYGISHNKVGSLRYDHQDRLWVGTEQGLDLYNPDNRTFTKNTLDEKLFNNRILSLLDDSFGNLWIGTLSAGLIQYNPQTKDYKLFQCVPDDPSSLPDNTVRTLFEDSERNLWVGTKNGLCRFDPKSSSFKQFGKHIFKDQQLSHQGIRCMTQDREQNLLIGTNEGLNILNTRTGSLSIYNPSKNVKGTLNHFYIYSLFIDKAQTVWLGTVAGGINYYSKYDQQFKFSSPGNLEQLVYGGVGPMAEKDDKLWIGTGGGGLFCYDRLKKTYSHFLVEESSYASNVVKALFIRGDTAFIGTDENKFLLFDTRRQKLIKSLPLFKNTIQNIYPAPGGKLFLCIRDTLGLRLVDPKSGQAAALTYRHPTSGRPMLFPFATCMEQENDSIYWIGTRYMGLFRYNINQQSALRFFNRPNNTNYLGSNHVSMLYADSRHKLWIATDGAGLSVYNQHSGQLMTYGRKEGLANETVLGMLPEPSGRLWISTLTGISSFDPVHETFKNYSYGNGFPLQEPGEHAYLALSDGSLCFGGNNGWVRFDPREIATNAFLPPLVITGFRLLHSDLNTGPSPLLQKLVPHNSSIRLNHNQSSFVIEYTALNYIFPDRNQYAYQLEGFDQQWNQVGKQRIAIYTNLHSGTYRFKLKASNNDGLWNEDFIALNIKVLPPPWLSWYAYVFYFILFAGLWLSILRYVNLENKVRIKQLEQENMEKSHQLRIRLFTNFSHELRTPLTLIIGPLEDLLNRTDVGQSVRHPLTMIQKNAQRLLLIVNQLMDFRKQEAGKMQLRASEGNFSIYLKEISLAFNELARKQKISYSFNSSHEEIPLWFDRQLVEKVIFNLLANAFKNTPPHGRITIDLTVKSTRKLKIEHINDFQAIEKIADEYVEITVTDTGRGISSQNLERIFDPFYQVCDGQQVATTGTGIGLSLSKGIVELHMGVISVKSDPGNGAAFKVLLPRGNQHLQEAQMIHDYIDEEDSRHYLVPFDTEELDQVEVAENQPENHTILIVEDNDEVRNYIKTHLKDSYHLLDARDGVEGFSRAVSEMPDLIISDVMMPLMDGLEMCGKLKNDVHTSHIPIVLLTALATFGQIKEGFEVGADDYVPKPFNPSLLKMKVNSLILNRERVRKAFSKKFPFEQVHVESSFCDVQFLDKIYAVMDKFLSDSEFDLDAFSGEIGMSRANLYRKIKALTNFAPNELLKNYRLRAAEKLLLESKYSVSEIAYMVGFATPAYFSSCFKKTYLLSPSEYLEKNPAEK